LRLRGPAPEKWSTEVKDSNRNISREARRSAAAENTLAYMGSMMSFLVDGAETQGKFALMEYEAKSGNEPPPHLHEFENETLYILEGEIEAYQGDAVLKLAPGDCLFTPMGEPHAWYILTPKLRMLIMVEPAFSDRYFKEMGQPTGDMFLPSGQSTYAQSDPQHAMAVGKKYGIKILTPEETRRALPKYRGFAADRSK
jgi:quercetin dioxygenase-like cupin family protein